jgi:hypothetical protein
VTIQAHIDVLERRCKILEDEIAEALRHRSTDDLMIVDLKRRKLHVEEELAQLRDEARVQARLSRSLTSPIMLQQIFSQRYAKMGK